MIENFDNQIKTKIGIKPEKFLDKISLSLTFNKKCIDKDKMSLMMQYSQINLYCI